MFKKFPKNKGSNIFVDDNPLILKAIKKKFPKVITIWLAGENFTRKKKLKRNSSIDYYLQNLSQLLEILKKLKEKRLKKAH